MTIDQLNNGLKKVKSDISAIGPLRPGSMTKQYNVCGSPGCACKDSKNPKKHGPYYKLRSTFGGKSTTKFIKPHFAKTMKNQLAEYKKLKQLVDDLVRLSIAISDLEQRED